MNRTMPEIDIREMTIEDLPFAVLMTDLEGWGNVIEDFQRLMFLEPDGCFVAWRGNERVGMISATTYGDYAFAGSLIVPAARRKQGIGSALLVHAVDYLQRRGITTVELDGTLEAVDLYRRHGFRDKYLSFRLMRPAQAAQPGNPKPSSVPDDEIVEFDTRRTGLKRGRILTRLREESAGSYTAAGQSSLAAYGMVRRRSEGRYAIGPLVAADLPQAIGVLDSVLSDYPSAEIAIGVPAEHQRFADALVERGFLYRPPSLRMYLGSPRHYERHMYAILSPEKG